MSKPSSTRSRVKNNAKNNSERSSMGRFVYVVMCLFLCLFFALAAYKYRHGIAYYLGFGTAAQKAEKTKSKEDGLHAIRNFEVLSRHDDMIAGIDVSQYQGRIKWDKVAKVEEDFPVRFVLIRATAGKNKVDSRFRTNWKGARDNYLIRGAYHYYRPDEDPVAQADNFVNVVELKSGDLPPVLDIEDNPKKISMDQLRENIQTWCRLVERKYKMKPIIYSGDNFYKVNLKNRFPEHVLWIANYNFFVENIKPHWNFWQFSERGVATGIKGPVDLNIYQGSYDDFITLTKK